MKSSFLLFVCALFALVGAAAPPRPSASAAVISRLESAMATGDKFGAEDILAELEKLIPSDLRMAGLRDRVSALPGLDKSVSIDLGGGVRIELVLVRPGSFTMGSESGGSDEKPVHQVTLTQPFYLGKFEVTQEQWESVMGNNPSEFKGSKLPVENVSWKDCQKFLAKLGEKSGRKFALPTEAQWEYACRAGSTTRFSFGDADSGLPEYAWYESNSEAKTHPVGGKKANPWGLYDMHGNVWEWCADAHGKYPGEAVANPVDSASGPHRVNRGGAWYNQAEVCRSADRRGYFPGLRGGILGLRLALNAFR